MSPAGWEPPAFAVTTALCRLSGRRAQPPRTKRHPRGRRRPPPLAHTLLVLLRSARLVAHLRWPPGSSRAPSGPRRPAHARYQRTRLSLCPCRALQPTPAGRGRQRLARSWRQSRAAAPAEAAAALPPPSFQPRARRAGLGRERAARGSAGGHPEAAAGTAALRPGRGGRPEPLEPLGPLEPPSPRSEPAATLRHRLERGLPALEQPWRTGENSTEPVPGDTPGYF